MEATRAAWIRFFRRGLRADLVLDELMSHLPEIFRKTRYADYEAPRVLAMIKALTLADMGIGPTETGVGFDGKVI
jgi:hypothetical protein